MVEPDVSVLKAGNYKASKGTGKIPNRLAYQSHRTFTNYKCKNICETMATIFSFFFSYHQTNGQSMEKYSNMLCARKEKSEMSVILWKRPSIFTPHTCL